MSAPNRLGVYGIPTLLCVGSIAGLVLALVYDGLVEAVALAALACPLVLALRHVAGLAFPRRKTSRHP